MPLSPPAAREHIHTRTVTCQGFRREDGLWDIEGHLTDVKTYSFTNQFRGTIEPGVPLHEMWIRVTVDNRLKIVAIEAQLDHGPHEICPAITPNFQRLVGLSMRPGFTKAVKDRVGGVAGCTHLVELMGPVATTAFQTIFPILAREGTANEWNDSGDGDKPKGKPPLLNTCHAYASDGPVVKRAWSPGPV